MKRILATLLTLLLLVPAMGPWMPHGAVDAIHSQQEAHHQNDFSFNSHGHHHGLDSDEDHAPHFDILSYFDNLHVDLKNPPIAKVMTSQPDLSDVPFIPAADNFADHIFQPTTRQSRGPPYPEYRIAALGVPVYLATQRLRI